MRRLLNGRKRYLVLAFLLSGCRDSVPPKLSIICLGDGSGGADCTKADGTNEHLLPSQLLNFWMTTNADIANYSSWCNQTSVESVKPFMAQIEAKMKQ